MTTVLITYGDRLRGDEDGRCGDEDGRQVDEPQNFIPNIWIAFCL